MKKVLALVVVFLLMPLFAIADSNRIFDNAGLFSKTETVELDTAIKSFQEQTHFDFAILTTDDFLGSYNQKAVADSFYDSQGFGFDSVNSGILFYIDTNQGLNYLSTTGVLNELLADEEITQKFLDTVNPTLNMDAFKDAAIATMEFFTEISSEYLDKDASIFSTK